MTTAKLAAISSRLFRTGQACFPHRFYFGWHQPSFAATVRCIKMTATRVTKRLVTRLVTHLVTHLAACTAVRLVVRLVLRLAARFAARFATRFTAANGVVGSVASAGANARASAGAGAVAVGVIVGAALCLPDAAHAQKNIDGKVEAQFGDWQVVCKPPPPGARNRVCALVQSVTAEDRNNVGLTVYFQRFSNGTRVLRVFAPLGVLLPPGLGLKIDGKDVGHAPFLRCHSFACYAQVVVEDKLVQQLSRGKSAVFIIFQTEEAGIGIPISLAGFSKGLAHLK